MRLIDADPLRGRMVNGNDKITIDCAPTIDAVPVVHGRWAYNPERGEYRCTHCNDCGADDDERTDYCPSCGAKMDKEEADHA